MKPVRRAQGASIEETQAGSPRAPALKALALNHAAVGFAALPRPNLGFDGAWLAAPKMMVHIIKRDPSVPRRLCSWREQYAGEPEAWMIRRSAQLAFEVGSLEEAEHALRQHGVEYSRHVLPEANMRQLFLYDPGEPAALPCMLRAPCKVACHMVCMQNMPLTLLQRATALNWACTTTAGLSSRSTASPHRADGGAFVRRRRSLFS